MRKLLLLFPLVLLLLWLLLRSMGGDGADGGPGRPDPGTEPAGTPAETSTEEPPVPPAPVATAAAGGPTKKDTAWGRVTDDAGRPVAGVRVKATFLRYGSTSYPHHVDEAEVVTGEDGRFVLGSSGHPNFARLVVTPPAGYTPPPEIEIDSDGDVTLDLWERDIPSKAPADGTRNIYPSPHAGEGWPGFRIPIRRAAPIEGRVVGPDGEPRPGANVLAKWFHAPLADRHLWAEADERGRFSVPVPAAVREVALLARDKDGLPGSGPGYRGRLRPGATGIEIRIPMTHRVHVRTRIDADVQLRQARFVLVPRDPVNLKRVEENVHRDPEEPFLLKEVPPGEYAMRIYPIWRSMLPAEVPLTVPGPEVTVELGLGVAVTGTVEGVDPDRFVVTWTGPGNPLDAEGYPFHHFNNRDHLVGEWVEVGKDGSFRIRGCEDVPGTLYVRKVGDPRCALLEGVRPSDGPFRLELAEGRRISGTVVGLKDGEWRAVYARAVRGKLVQQAPLREDGTFGIVGLPPGEFRVLAVGVGIGTTYPLSPEVRVSAGSHGTVLDISVR